MRKQLKVCFRSKYFTNIGQLTRLDGHIDAQVQIVVNHATVVIPKQVDWILNAPQHSARQPQ